MSRHQCRGSIVGAAVLVALLSSRPADAQVGIDPGPPREPGGLCNKLATGVWYDVVNQKLAVHHLEHLEAKLRSNAERGDTTPSGFHLRQIDNLKYRITIDEWLIRWNSLHYPDFYPIRTDPVSCAAIAQASHPIYIPDDLRQVQPPPPMPPAPTIPITIINAESSGTGIVFAINGLTYQVAPSSRKDLAIPFDSTITFEVGGSVGERRYRITQGLYEFRSTAEGLMLFKLPSMP